MVRNLGTAGIVGPIVFIVLTVVQGVLQPDYSHVALPISALAAWPLGWMQNLSFVILGVLLIAFAIGLHQGFDPRELERSGPPCSLSVASGH